MHPICIDCANSYLEKTYTKCDGCIKDNPQFGYIQLYYFKAPLLYVTTPPMKCLFGVQNKGGGNFQMNLQFTDLEEDNQMRQFYDFIESCEFYAMKYLEEKILSLM